MFYELLGSKQKTAASYPISVDRKAAAAFSYFQSLNTSCNAASSAVYKSVCITLRSWI
jgi:hypothetical protein